VKSFGRGKSRLPLSLQRMTQSQLAGEGGEVPKEEKRVGRRKGSETDHPYHVVGKDILGWELFVEDCRYGIRRGDTGLPSKKHAVALGHPLYSKKSLDRKRMKRKLKRSTPVTGVSLARLAS